MGIAAGAHLEEELAGVLAVRVGGDTNAGCIDVFRFGRCTPPVYHGTPPTLGFTWSLILGICMPFSHSPPPPCQAQALLSSSLFCIGFGFGRAGTYNPS